MLAKNLKIILKFFLVEQGSKDVVVMPIYEGKLGIKNTICYF